MSDLNEILNGTEAPAPAVEAPVEALAPPPASADAPPALEAPADDAAPAAGRARDDQGRFIPKGETGAEVPVDGAPPAPKDEVALDHPALLAERRLRQAAQAEVARIRAERETAPPASTPALAPSGPPDRYEDPEGYDQWLRDTIRAEAVAEARGVMENQRIAASAATARGKYQDWEPMVQLFAELAQQNPGLEASLRGAENPGEFAYSTAKLHLELRQHGSLDALIAARVAAAREAALAEVAGTAPSAERPQLPDSLAGHQSSRASAAAAPAPLSLEDILNPSRK